MHHADDITALYQAMLADAPPRRGQRGLLCAPSHAADGDNPLCGDHLRVELRMVDDRVVEVGFAGDCCVVCRLSAALMCDLLEGCLSEEIDALMGCLAATLHRDVMPVDPRFERFLPLRRLPQRHRCAWLPWATAQSALRGQSVASTEKQSR